MLSIIASDGSVHTNVCDTRSVGTKWLRGFTSKVVHVEQTFIQNDSFQVIVGLDKVNNFINEVLHICKAVDTRDMEVVPKPG